MRRILASFALLLLLLVPQTTVATTAAYTPLGDACKAAGNKPAACSDNKGTSLTGSNGIIAKAANIIALVAGISAVIIIVISGIMYITSGGDPQSVSRAKNTLIYAVVGLVIVVLARTIITFVLSKI